LNPLEVIKTPLKSLQRKCNIISPRWIAIKFREDDSNLNISLHARVSRVFMSSHAARGFSRRVREKTRLKLLSFINAICDRDKAVEECFSAAFTLVIAREKHRFAW
jgi:hypothetical protein